MSDAGPDLTPFLDALLRARRRAPARRSVLAAVSGIDGCGKGWLSARLVDALRARALRAEAVNIDGWLNLPARRYSELDPAAHFYAHAIRFEELFDRLVLPLRERRSLRLEADFTEETATRYRRHVYAYDDLDVVVLEGIFLLRRDLRRHYDASLWIECSFDTARERAIARAQEGLAPEQTERAYRTIYHAAQAIHLERDDPRGAASHVVVNDPRLES